MWTDENLVEMYKHLVVYVLETAMNKTEHGVCLLDFVCQVFGKLGVVLVNMFLSLWYPICIVLHFATLNLSFHLSGFGWYVGGWFWCHQQISESYG